LQREKKKKNILELIFEAAMKYTGGQSCLTGCPSARRALPGSSGGAEPLYLDRLDCLDSHIFQTKYPSFPGTFPSLSNNIPYNSNG
jgi:hypothetical protein